MRWPVVSVQSGSRPRLRRLRRARKPTASKNSPADHQGRRILAGMGRWSPGAGLRSALELRSSSGSCSDDDDGDDDHMVSNAGLLYVVTTICFCS